MGLISSFLQAKTMRGISKVIDGVDDGMMQVKKMARPRARHHSPAWLGPKPIHVKTPGAQPIHIKQDFNGVNTIIDGTVFNESQVHALRDNTGGVVNWARSQSTPEAASRRGRL
jgi:hypothetical protein